MPDSEETGGPQAPQDERAAAERAARDAVVEARRQAALALIRTFGDPALRTKAGEVTRFDDSLSHEVARMGRIMGDALGVGLAATQLGVMHKLLVYRTAPDAPLVAVANPRIEWMSQETEVGEEGCLSLPGVLLDVERAVHLRVSAKDQRGESIAIEASGMDARVIQHEIDHLDGVLILDRATTEQRKEAMRILREGPPRDATPERAASDHDHPDGASDDRQPAPA
jgi:peptide deformylase